MKFNLSPKSSTILEIRDQELRLLVLENGTLQKTVRRQIPQEIIRNGQVLNIQGLGNEIKSFIKDQSGKIHGLNIIFPGLRTICRTIEVPKMSGNLRSRFLERQIDKEMPFKVTELYISTFSLGRNAAETQDEMVLLIGIPRYLVDRLNDALYMAGIKEASFTIRPFALASLATKEDAIIFDIEADEFTIIITHHCQPLMVYSKSLANSESARGSSRDTGTLAEIQRSYEYLREFLLKHKDLQKLSCYVTGAGSRDKSIRASIKSTFGLNIEAPDYDTTFTEDRTVKPGLKAVHAVQLELPVLRISFLDEVRCGAYDSGLGLLSLLGKSGRFSGKMPNVPGHIATRSIHGPPTFVEKAFWRSLDYVPYVLGVLLLAYIFYIYQGQQNILQDKREEVQRLQSKEKAERMALLKARRLDTEQKKIQSSLDELVNEYKNIDKKLWDYKESLQYLMDLATDIDITSLSASNNKLTLEGSAKEMQAALDYATVVGKGTMLSGVRITNLKTIGGGAPGAPAQYNFTLLAEISKPDLALQNKNLSSTLKEVFQGATVRKD